MHNVCFESYNEKVNKQQVQDYWDDYARHEDRHEGCDGLVKKIRWIEYVCDSYKQAEEYIRAHDTGWYDQLAVKYRTSVKPTTKTYKELVDRRNEICATLQERQNKVHYAAENTKSEYITCKHCGSRLATKYIHSNSCPLCRSDLRPVSSLNAIETSKRMLKEIDKKISVMENSATKKGKIQWLVKIEYHT